MVENDQAIIDVLDGGLDDTNVAAAGFADTSLASPNNSVYRTLLVAGGAAITDLAAGTYFLPATGNLGLSGGAGNIFSAGTATPAPLLYFDDADYTVGSKTQKLYLRAQVSTNATAWSSVTATFGLYPVTFAGGNDVLTMTLGTVVSGSTVAIANPGASATSQGNSGDFTIPSDGQYCLGVVTSAQLTNNAASLLSAQLRTRHV